MVPSSPVSNTTEFENHGYPTVLKTGDPGAIARASLLLSHTERTAKVCKEWISTPLDLQ